MFPDNNWYGHRSILLKYLGLKDRTVFAWIQHGWQSQVLKKFSEGRKKKFFPLLFWSKSNQIFYNKHIKAYPIGAPFLYLCKMLNKSYNNIKIKPKGTLVFPVHTNQDYSQECNHQDLIAKVKKISPGPYTACFYYYDFTKKNTLIYTKNNWRVVCCVKNKTDKDSLYRLYDEINNHKSIVCSEFTTALFYSMYLKKRTKVIIGKELILEAKSEKAFLKFYKNKYPELFKSFLPPQKSHELAKKELGFQYMRKKDELKKILGLNSIIKIIIAKIFEKLYDIKYTDRIRKGKDMSDKHLIKYISAVRNFKN
jgi:hypothetical protein